LQKAALESKAHEDADGSTARFEKRVGEGRVAIRCKELQRFDSKSASSYHAKREHPTPRVSEAEEEPHR
jgi:hypothetical protein